MPDRMPLCALLSGTLVAHTIELDNAAEDGFAHRTTAMRQRGEPGRGVWLTSVVMWANCLRYLVDGEATVAEVAARARTGTNVDGVRRWG